MTFSMTTAIFHDFPGLENGLPKFHDFPWPGVTLLNVSQDKEHNAPIVNNFPGDISGITA